MLECGYVITYFNVTVKMIRHYSDVIYCLKMYRNTFIYKCILFNKPTNIKIVIIPVLKKIIYKYILCIFIN